MRPHIERLRFSLGCLALAALIGCGGKVAPKIEIPADAARLLPRDFEILHQESTDAPTSYALWLLRSQGAAAIAFPRTMKDVDHHDLPGEIVANLFQAKAPSIDATAIRSKPCRFTHWSAGPVEYQLREAVADGQWLATLEMIQKPAATP